jgi:hypothetical protein
LKDLAGAAGGLIKEDGGLLMSKGGLINRGRDRLLLRDAFKESEHGYLYKVY